MQTPCKLVIYTLEDGSIKMDTIERIDLEEGPIQSKIILDFGGGCVIPPSCLTATVEDVNGSNVSGIEEILELYYFEPVELEVEDGEEEDEDAVEEYENEAEKEAEAEAEVEGETEGTLVGGQTGEGIHNTQG